MKKTDELTDDRKKNLLVGVINTQKEMRPPVVRGDIKDIVNEEIAKEMAIIPDAGQGKGK